MENGEGKTRRISDPNGHAYERARKRDTIAGVIMSITGAVIAIAPLFSPPINIPLVILGVITTGISAGNIDKATLKAFLRLPLIILALVLMPGAAMAQVPTVTVPRTWLEQLLVTVDSLRAEMVRQRAFNRSAETTGTRAIGRADSIRANLNRVLNPPPIVGEDSLVIRHFGAGMMGGTWAQLQSGPIRFTFIGQQAQLCAYSYDNGVPTGKSDILCPDPPDRGLPVVMGLLQRALRG